MLGIGIQSLEPLEVLHRDVKPWNGKLNFSFFTPVILLVTIDRKEIGEQGKIYMLDFGMARKYVKEDAPPFTIHHLRERTVHYAPISCHVEREQSRKDCESWLSMMVELTSESSHGVKLPRWARWVRLFPHFPDLYV